MKFIIKPFFVVIQNNTTNGADEYARWVGVVQQVSSFEMYWLMSVLFRWNIVHSVYTIRLRMPYKTRSQFFILHI
jgi:hypothetical protein